MPTVYYEQIKTSLEAEIDKKDKIIEELTKQVYNLTKQRDLIKSKWEVLHEHFNREVFISIHEPSGTLAWTAAVNDKVVYEGANLKPMIFSILDEFNLNVRTVDIVQKPL